MHFNLVSLRQFRNFSRLDLRPGPGLNIFLGPNGAGKSNILEGVSILASGQSHRGAEARHWLQEGTQEAALVARVEGEEPLDLDLRQRRGRARQLKVNNRSILRQRDWAGRIPLVSFSPEEMGLVKGEPSVRRRALNAVLSQVDPAYADTLGRYTRLLEERNAALRRIRDGLAKQGILEPWDLSLLKEGARLTLWRHEFLLAFGPRLQQRQAGLSGGRDRGAALYRPSFHLPVEETGGVEDANRRRLADLREGEIALGSTLIGPHRDDVELRLDDDLAKVRASQGQARTLALAWKWEERLVLKERLNREPIVLLDDVFSELDAARREQLTELVLSGGQCFMTMTDLSAWGPAAPAPNAQVLQVAAGAVRGASGDPVPAGPRP
jgi:DNA replication and repair protein RecF